MYQKFSCGRKGYCHAHSLCSLVYYEQLFHSQRSEMYTSHQSVNIIVIANFVLILHYDLQVVIRLKRENHHHHVELVIGGINASTINSKLKKSL